MAKVFLSHSTKDHLSAELATLELEGSGIELWRDHGQLRDGSDWRSGIERIREIEADATSEDLKIAEASAQPAALEPTAKSILSCLNQLKEGKRELAELVP